MTPFTPLMSTLGGGLIGLSAVVLMASLGRIAGMTGIVAGLVPPQSKDRDWRAVFLLGAIVAPFLLGLFKFTPAFDVPISTPMLMLGGVIVGIGTNYGAGCPSGHGICGLSRFSPRSIVAVITFMITTAITVYVVRHVMGA